MPRYDLKVRRMAWANVDTPQKVYTDIGAETIGPYYDLAWAKLEARLLIIGDENIHSIHIEYNEWQPAFFIVYRDHDYDDPKVMLAIQEVEKRI